jgi:zeaxanthin glucosyltransferase
MMRIGVLCPEIHGHLNPMLALAAEMRRRGHSVTLVGIADGESRAIAAGINFRPIGESVFPLGAYVTQAARLAKLSGLSALRYTIDLYVQHAAVLLDEAPHVLSQLNVDALLVDQTIVPGKTIAEIVGVPFANVCGALPMNREPGVPPAVIGWSYRASWWGRWRNRLGYRAIELLVRPMERLIAEHRRQRTLRPEPMGDNCFSQLAQIGQLPKCFDFPRKRLPSCFHYTGPLSDANSRPEVAFPYDALDGRPLVYASLGTIQNGREHLYRVIAEAFVGLEMQLVISLGGSRWIDASRALPGSPLVVEFAPQLELLDRATLVITHAGMNSVLEALARGKPLVAMPVTNDQPAVAARIAWTGCGKVVPLNRLNAMRLRQTIHEVMSQPTYRNAALRLGRAIQVAGGVTKAAQIVEQALSTNTPVLSENG